MDFHKECKVAYSCRQSYEGSSIVTEDIVTKDVSAMSGGRWQSQSILVMNLVGRGLGGSGRHPAPDMTFLMVWLQVGAQAVDCAYRSGHSGVDGAVGINFRGCGPTYFSSVRQTGNVRLTTVMYLGDLSLLSYLLPNEHNRIIEDNHFFNDVLNLTPQFVHRICLHSVF